MVSQPRSTTAGSGAATLKFHGLRVILLVPADGWYEWREESGRKQPYHFHLAGRALFLFAGIWERWTSPAGEAVDTVALITTEPNTVAARVHDRMPVIVVGSDVDAWLDLAAESDALQALLRPFGGEMECYAVGLAVNRAKNDGPECVEPLK